MAENKFMSLAAQQYYDQKLKAWVSAEDAKILQAAKEHAEGYADGLADNYDPAGTAQSKVNELAEGQVKTNKEDIAKLNGDASTEGSVAKAIADAKALIDADIDAVEKKADDAQADADALEADMGDVDGLSTTNKTVVGAINEVLAAVGTGGTAAVVTISTETTTEGALKSYTFKQGTATIGTIDIPKDMVVTSGEVVTNPEGQAAGTYIKLGLANVADPLYINVGTLVDIYKAKAEAAQVQIVIDSATREISASIVAGSVGTTELADNAVVTAKIADANVTKAKLSTAVQASLDKADAAATKAEFDEEVERAKKAEAQALTDAKAYTDQQIGGVDLSGIAQNAEDIDAIEESLAEGGATANAIAEAKKAGTDAAAAVTALENGKVATLRSDVDALQAITFVEITNAEIDAMFAAE